MMPQQVRLVGLDVSKRKIDGCIRGVDRCSAPCTLEGEAELIAWLRRHSVRVAVMEASGGYERHWAEALRAAGLTVRIVDPKRVRHFARALGKRAKNDPIDAEMIAWFAETCPAEAIQAPDPERIELDGLMTARAGLKAIETQIVQQGEHRRHKLAARAHAAVLKTLRAQLRALDAAIAARIRANPAFARRAEIVASVPGLADQTAAGIIAWFPELGHISDQAVAALLGVAPYDDDSGEHKGVRHIQGGRRKLRNHLYMPMMGAATQHNPVLKAYYQRLIAKGKDGKVALVACMRKLIVILNTMLARDQTWNPPARAAA
jgi:transposase